MKWVPPYGNRSAGSAECEGRHIVDGSRAVDLGYPIWRIACRHPPYRFRVPGGTYFFTANMLERRVDTLVRHVDALREAVLVTRRERLFHTNAR